MTSRKCRCCGHFLGRYLIVALDGLYCPRCGPKVDGGQIQHNAQRHLDRLARAR
jgi:hypothetical protein